MLDVMQSYKSSDLQLRSHKDHYRAQDDEGYSPPHRVDAVNATLRREFDPTPSGRVTAHSNGSRPPGRSWSAPRSSLPMCRPERWTRAPIRGARAPARGRRRGRPDPGSKPTPSTDVVPAGAGPQYLVLMWPLWAGGSPERRTAATDLTGRTVVARRIALCARTGVGRGGPPAEASPDRVPGCLIKRWGGLFRWLVVGVSGCSTASRCPRRRR
jgi:hypothetical protein